MVTTRKRTRRTIAKLSVAAVAFASLGVAVVAAPTIHGQPRMESAGIALQPLATGPALRLAKAGSGASEDCVRVTRMVGPDGREYPTNGVVCGGE